MSSIKVFSLRYSADESNFQADERKEFQRKEKERTSIVKKFIVGTFVN